jgi:hypothetical protein
MEDGTKDTNVAGCAQASPCPANVTVNPLHRLPLPAFAGNAPYIRLLLLLIPRAASGARDDKRLRTSPLLLSAGPSQAVALHLVLS